MRRPETLLVTAVGVAPQRVPRPATLRALDLQMAAGPGLVRLWNISGPIGNTNVEHESIHRHEDGEIWLY
jgi:hypothetical protein